MPDRLDDIITRNAEIVRKAAEAKEAEIAKAQEDERAAVAAVTLWRDTTKPLFEECTNEVNARTRPHGFGLNIKQGGAKGAQIDVFQLIFEKDGQEQSRYYMTVNVNKFGIVQPRTPLNLTDFPESIDQNKIDIEWITKLMIDFLDECIK